MKDRVAIVGAGVSGLTCGVAFAESGYRTAIFAEETGQRTTSGVAAALWFPYDAEPAAAVIEWALETYQVLVDLNREPLTGVSMIELCQFSRTGEIQIPDWAIPLGASAVPMVPSVISSEVSRCCGITGPQSELPRTFTSGFAMTVPLMDTTIYLDYLAKRFLGAGGEIHSGIRFERPEDVTLAFDVVINCTGIGAKNLVHDEQLEPHRGQVAIVPKIENLTCAIVCDDPPLMYAIPRANNCVFGGTNEVSDELDVDPIATARILDECSRALKIEKPNVLSERVGLRPFRKSGVRLERGCLRDGRTVVHNYGHGGSGFTLSWGCANAVFDLASSG